MARHALVLSASQWVRRGAKRERSRTGSITVLRRDRSSVHNVPALPRSITSSVMPVSSHQPSFEPRTTVSAAASSVWVGTFQPTRTARERQAGHERTPQPNGLGFSCRSERQAGAHVGIDAPVAGRRWSKKSRTAFGACRGRARCRWRTRQVSPPSANSAGCCRRRRRTCSADRAAAGTPAESPHRPVLVVALHIGGDDAPARTAPPGPATWRDSSPSKRARPLRGRQAAAPGRQVRAQARQRHARTSCAGTPTSNKGASAGR